MTPEAESAARAPHAGTPARPLPARPLPARRPIGGDVTRRSLWLSVGLTAVGLALLGVVLPLLPTTPFLLLAAFAFTRSSPRLHDWLITHRQFGPLIEDWRLYGSIAPRAKAAAVAAMAATFAGSWIAGLAPTILAVQAVALGGSALFVLSRPSGRR